jgi:hypothetical protein
MATPTIITVRDFTTSPYSQLVDNLDTPLNDIIVRAESAVESYLGYTVAPSSFTEQWRAASQTLFVRHRPIISVQSLNRRLSTSYGWETVDPSTYMVEHEAGYIEVDTMVQGYQVQVTYLQGLDPIPPVVQQAVIMMAVTMSYQDLEVYGSGDSHSPGILYIRDDIKAMLNPFAQNPTIYH